MMNTGTQDFDECVATGESCSYGPHGLHGEEQCQYCGKRKGPPPGEEPEQRIDSMGRLP
jgi:hypothetical protein